MDSNTCKNCRYSFRKEGSKLECHCKPPTPLLQHGAIIGAFPAVEPDWTCGSFRVSGFEKGTRPKLSDEEIRAMVAVYSLPGKDDNGGDLPPVAFKRSEVVDLLEEKGMTRTPAIKRIETLVKRGILKMGPNPFPRKYPTPGTYYWVEAEPGEAVSADVSDAQIVGRLRATGEVGVREFQRVSGLGISLTTLQRRLAALAEAGAVTRTEAGWKVAQEVAS